MKIDTSRKIRHTAGEHIIIQQAHGESDLTSVVVLNSTALELYEAMKARDFTVDDVARHLCDRYEVDPDTARRDAAEWVEQMLAQKIIVA